MKTKAYLGLVLGLGLTACGGDSGGGDTEGNSTGGGGGSIPIGSSVDVNADGLADGVALDANGDGIAESIDNNMDGKPDGVLPAGATVVGSGGNGGTNGAGTTSGGGNTNNGDVPISGTEDDGGATGNDNNGSNMVVVEDKASIVCGDSEVEVDVSAGYVCCDSLTGDAWAAPSVKAKAMCNSYSGGGFGGPATDAVGSSCDGKDDCGSSFCCFAYNTMGPPASAVDRAHGRRCLSEASCNAAGGVEGQSGVFSCNDVSDCPSVFTECVAEPKGVTSSNKAGRPWVKVCK